MNNTSKILVAVTLGLLTGQIIYRVAFAQEISDISFDTKQGIAPYGVIYNAKTGETQYYSENKEIYLNKEEIEVLQWDRYADEKLRLSL